jgi:hypothetical protein
MVNIIHIIGPFIINLSSTIIILVNRVRQKHLVKDDGTPSKKKNYGAILLEQIWGIKQAWISPCLLLAFGLPRLVLTFVFACIRYSWQEDLYMGSYLVSFVPMTATLIIFVLPSTAYVDELKTNRFIKFFAAIRRQKAT